MKLLTAVHRTGAAKSALDFTDLPVLTPTLTPTSDFLLGRTVALKTGTLPVSVQRRTSRHVGARGWLKNIDSPLKNPFSKAPSECETAPGWSRALGETARDLLLKRHFTSRRRGGYGL